MKTLLQILGAVLSVISSIFGLAWLKRRIEARAEAKERERLNDLAQDLADVITEKDLKIDHVADSQKEEASLEKRRIEQAIADELRRKPTREDVRRLIEESKK